MRYLSLLFLCCLLRPAIAQDSAYTAALQRYLETAGVMKVYDVVLDRMIDMEMESDQAGLGDDFWNDLRMEMKTSVNDMVEMLGPVYYKHLSQQDLEGLTAFFSGPLGKKFVEETPLMVQESMEVGREWGRVIGERLVQRIEQRQRDR